MSIDTPTRPPVSRPTTAADGSAPTGSSALSSRRTSTVADRAARVRFRRALALMAMTLVLPGSAQLAAGNKRVGRVAVYLWVGLLALAVGSVLAAVLHHRFAFWLVSDLAALQAVRLVLMGLAVGWAALLVDAWRIGSPLSLSLGHRRAAVGVNAVLCFSVAAVLLFGAHLVGVQRHLIASVFGDGSAVGAHDGRYNVLLIGGDSGVSRWGLRPDSMTVASIDATTGRTVLIGLPRNMENFPFAKGSVMRQQFPHGFRCGTGLDDCMLNGVYTWALDHAKLFGGSANPGLDAVQAAVQGITGLQLNYWALVNLQGFRNLINAFGGVTVDVRQPIPVGGLGSDVTGYIQPGVKKLSGDQALWYARSRDSSDDYSRMARQKCLMNDMLHQVQPQVVVENFQKIAQASSAMVSTSIPAGEVDRFMDLAIKAKGQKIATLSLVPPLIDTAHPDVQLIHDEVAKAVSTDAGTTSAPADESADGKDTPAGATSGATTGSSAASAQSGSGHTGGGGTTTQQKQPQVVTGGSIGSLHTGYAANQTTDLSTAC